MRASIVRKAVLLEGSPGVGKTSIVEALAAALAVPIIRINLSEQTDMMDLLGTFLPQPVDHFSDIEEEESTISKTMQNCSNCNGNSSSHVSNSHSGPQFVWSDGALLRAVKNGAWVILDELNLANQSVL
uniref:Midasin n=1 Tax=Lygus hesperus TaxID=30085 RepID=A0A0A9XR73_LYGHE